VHSHPGRVTVVAPEDAAPLPPGDGGDELPSIRAGVEVRAAPERPGSLQRIEQLKTQRTETEDVILKRRSVRIYRRRQVPEFMVRRILEAGRFAPSAGNGQPWKFVVLRDPEIIRGLTLATRRVAKIFNWFINYQGSRFSWRLPLAKLFIRVKANDLHPAPFSAIPLIADGRLDLYHGAPTVILILKDVRGVSNPDLDCGIAGQNMALAAHSMGLGTCWVSFTKLAFQYGWRWRRHLGIRYPYQFVSSLAVGFPVGEPDRMVPRPTAAVDWFEDGEKKSV
jgi:nitroreductase